MSSHGMSKTPIYRIWNQMIQRCENPKCKDYKNYGGRGIKVCEHWHDFRNFYADIGKQPKGKWIDRWPDNNGNYEPRNVRWATPKQNNNNRRNHVVKEKKYTFREPRIKNLIALCGNGGPGRKEAAKKLDVDLSYIYLLEHGKRKPGKHLYQILCRLCEKLEVEKNG